MSDISMERLRRWAKECPYKGHECECSSADNGECKSCQDQRDMARELIRLRKIIGVEMGQRGLWPRSVQSEQDRCRALIDAEKGETK